MFNSSWRPIVYYRPTHRRWQLNRNFIFHSNIVTINRREISRLIYRAINTPVARACTETRETNERLLCLEIFRIVANCNFVRLVSAPYLEGTVVGRFAPEKRGRPLAAPRRKDSKDTKGPDLTSAFFPGCQNFHNGRNEALKFLRAFIPRFADTVRSLTPSHPREFLQTIHSDAVSATMRSRLPRASGFYIRPSIQNRPIFARVLGSGGIANTFYRVFSKKRAVKKGLVKFPTSRL